MWHVPLTQLPAHAYLEGCQECKRIRLECIASLLAVPLCVVLVELRDLFAGDEGERGQLGGRQQCLQWGQDHNCRLDLFPDSRWWATVEHAQISVQEMMRDEAVACVHVTTGCAFQAAGLPPHHL
jgi:hypothetical protein